MMFIKRLITQGIIMLGGIVVAILAIIGVDLIIACVIGGGISFGGIVFGCIKLRCPFCHAGIPIQGFFIEYCPMCGEKI